MEYKKNKKNTHTNTTRIYFMHFCSSFFFLINFFLLQCLYKLFCVINTETKTTNVLSCLIFSLVFSFLSFSEYYQNPMDGRFYCSVCGRNYVRKKHVLRHMRYECVNVPPRFHCANCLKNYRQSNALLHHIRQKHGPLARDTYDSIGYTQRNFNVATDGRIIFSFSTQN